MKTPFTMAPGSPDARPATGFTLFNRRADSGNVDVVYGPDDTLTPLIMHYGEATVSPGRN